MQWERIWVSEWEFVCACFVIKQENVGSNLKCVAISRIEFHHSRMRFKCIQDQIVLSLSPLLINIYSFIWRASAVCVSVYFSTGIKLKSHDYFVQICSSVILRHTHTSHSFLFVSLLFVFDTHILISCVYENGFKRSHIVNNKMSDNKFIEVA